MFEGGEDDVRVLVSRNDLEYVIDVLHVVLEVLNKCEDKLCRKCKAELYKTWKIAFKRIEDKWILEKPIRTMYELVENAVETLIPYLHE